MSMAMSVGPSVMCRKCLDIIQSRDRHDFVRCTCGAIAIDGGAEYLRVIGHGDDFIWDFEEDTDRNQGF